MLTVINKYKYQLLLFVVSALCLYFFLQSINKDHSLDLVKQKINLEEKARQEIIDTRKYWEGIVTEKNKQIQYGILRDSFSQVNTLLLYDQLNKLPNKYNEKVKAITNYGSDELREYFRNLPKQPDNDY